MEKENNTQTQIRRIDEQIKTLRARRAVLLKQAPAEWLLSIKLRGEKVTSRNFDKLVALAYTLDMLGNESYSGGAKTKQISTYLRDTIGLQIKEATLRSYLTRFKEQRRLDFDEKNRLWVLPIKQN